MTDSVDAEAAWLVRHMNRTGIGNLRLHEFLTTTGWAGAANNISNWRNGQARIPLELVPRLVLAFGMNPLAEGMGEVLRFLRVRHPELSPYFREDVADHEDDAPVTGHPVYVGRRGESRGKRYVPYRDAEGRYVAGTSRFEEDKVLFDDLASLVKGLRAKPELRVRMVPEESPRSAPSLIRQESLVWE